MRIFGPAAGAWDVIFGRPRGVRLRLVQECGFIKDFSYTTQISLGFQLYHTNFIRISQALNFGPTRLKDDVPPETVNVLFSNGGIFGQAAEVVLVGSNISNDPKVYGKYINTLGCTLL